MARDAVSEQQSLLSPNVDAPHRTTGGRPVHRHYMVLRRRHLWFCQLVPTAGSRHLACGHAGGARAHLAVCLAVLRCCTGLAPSGAAAAGFVARLAASVALDPCVGVPVSGRVCSAILLLVLHEDAPLCVLRYPAPCCTCVQQSGAGEPRGPHLSAPTAASGKAEALEREGERLQTSPAFVSVYAAPDMVWRHEIELRSGLASGAKRPTALSQV